MVIQIRFAFSSNKLQISTHFDSRTVLAWKSYTKSEEKKIVNQNRSTPRCSEDRQTYIHTQYALSSHWLKSISQIYVEHQIRTIKHNIQILFTMDDF